MVPCSSEFQIPNVTKRHPFGINPLDNRRIFDRTSGPGKHRIGPNPVHDSSRNGCMKLKLARFVGLQQTQSSQRKLQPIGVPKQVFRQRFGFDEQEQSQHRTLLWPILPRMLRPESPYQRKSDHNCFTPVDALSFTSFYSCLTSTTGGKPSIYFDDQVEMKGSKLCWHNGSSSLAGISA